MSELPILGHGGAAGAALEIGFVLIPVLIFAVLAWWSKRKQEPEDGDRP